MEGLVLSRLPLLAVGARAHAQSGLEAAAGNAEWELWASADDIPSACRVIPAGANAKAAQASGHTVFRWPAPEGGITARVCATGASGAMFIRANADAPRVMTPTGLVPVARPASLMLIAKASLIEAEDWLAHMREYHDLRPHVRDEDISPLERSAYELRSREAAARAKPVHRVSMRVPNEVFFGSFTHGDIRLYEHDDLHCATCYYDVPLYLKLKAEPELAFIPRGNFERLDHRDRVRLVREECFAIALERVVIPAETLGIRYRPEEAYLYALHRVCTDLATGWFRDFAIDAFPDAEAIDTDYVDRFHAAISAGRARRRRKGPISAGIRQALADNLDRVASRQWLAGLPGEMCRAVVNE